MLYLAVFFVLLVIYTALFWIDIKASLDYIRNEKNEWVVLSFYTRDGFFLYCYEIPLAKTIGNKVKFRLVKGKFREIRTGTENNYRLTPLDIYKKYIRARSYLKDHGSLFGDIRKYLNKRDVHVELKIKLKQGTGDAAQTGLLCGLLWTAAGILITYLSRFLKAFKKEIVITPCFDRKVFEVDVCCIFHVKLVHIIVVLIKIYNAKYHIKMKANKTIGGEVSG